MSDKMIMCIIHSQDADGLVQALNTAGLRVTRLSTTGGFMRQGNTTLLIGVREEQVEQVNAIIQENTHPRSHKGWWARPGQHELAAATIFVLDMEQASMS